MVQGTFTGACLPLTEEQKVKKDKMSSSKKPSKVVIFATLQKQKQS
jgi:hypothetical protein